MNCPDTSIIVVYHSGVSFLKACLKSLLDTTESNHEILVIVNNNEKKVHLELPFKREKRIKYHHEYESLGHAKAANIGVQLAKNEYVIVSDHDLVFHHKWFENLWLTYSKKKNIGAVSCKVVDAKSGRLLDFGIAYSKYNFGHPGLDLELNHPLLTKDRKAQMICSGGLLLKKEHFLEVGGFEEAFGTLYTDLDICLKLKKANLDVYASAGALAYHFGGEYSRPKRIYKANFLKSDVKGVFMKNHANILHVDMNEYFDESIEYFKSKGKDFDEYFFCNLMNVVNTFWYEDLLQKGGCKKLDGYKKPSQVRDAVEVELFDLLGYDIMVLGVPIAYFVDRYTSILKNKYWWTNRGNKDDIVVDRNANIVSVEELIHGNGKF